MRRSPQFAAPFGEERRQAGPSYALYIVALGVVLAISYAAASVFQVLIISVLLSVLLVPGVNWLARWVPRSLASGVFVLLLVGAAAAAVGLMSSQVVEFVDALPRLVQSVRQMAMPLVERAQEVQTQAEQMLSTSRPQQPETGAGGTSWFSELLFPTLGAIFTFTVMTAFLPFLVFFMLNWSGHVHDSLVQLFEQPRRAAVSNALGGIVWMIRHFLWGNLLVGAILAAASVALFLVVQLPHALVMGILSGFVSLIPYLGFLIAVIGPVLVAVGQFDSASQYAALLVPLIAIHLVGYNLLLPKIVGREVDLNPLAVTVAILVWGWMWGALGLILGVPILAGVKVICNNTPALAGLGRLLGK